MDPEATYKEMMEITKRILDSGPNSTYDADYLAELVLAMDGWLKKGGFLPKAWQR